MKRPPRKITVRDVMTASEHQTFEMNCDSHQVDADRCSPTSGCLIRPVWQALQFRIDEFLGSVTLADLLRDDQSPALVPLSPASSSPA